MTYKQLDIYDMTKELEKKKKVAKNELNTTEHEILNTIKVRPVATEAIMDTYGVDRIKVRQMIKRIRNHKIGHTIIQNCMVKYNGKMCHGYSVEGNDLLFARWKSSTETMLNNNPFLLEMAYAHLNRIKDKLDRPSEHQTKIPLTPHGKPHDVHYKDYPKNESESEEY